jgi:hypothetical protein
MPPSDSPATLMDCQTDIVLSVSHEDSSVSEDAGDCQTCATKSFCRKHWWSHISEKDRAYLTQPRHVPDPCPWCGGRLRHNPLCVVLTWAALPFGKHKDKPICEVRREYLVWLLREHRLDPFLRGEIIRMFRSRGWSVPEGVCENQNTIKG